jgi:hypothetical protein
MIKQLFHEHRRFFQKNVSKLCQRVASRLRQQEAVNKICQKVKRCRFKLAKSGRRMPQFKNKNFAILVDAIYRWIAFEIFSEGICKTDAKDIKNNQYVVIDMGSNQCSLSLYFRNKSDVKKMFAFKLIPEVCMLGQKCLN